MSLWYIGIFLNCSIQKIVHSCYPRRFYEHQKQKTPLGFNEIPYDFLGFKWYAKKTGVEIPKGFKERCGDYTGALKKHVGISNRNPKPPYLSLWQRIQAMRVPLTGSRVRYVGVGGVPIDYGLFY